MQQPRVLAAPFAYAGKPRWHSAAFSRLIGEQDFGGERNGSRERRRRKVSPVFRHFVSGTLFVLVTALIFAYWAGFPLVNTIYLHEYPRFGSPPHPNLFKSSRYVFDWWVVWSLTLNALLPLTFMMALAENRIQEYSRLHVIMAAVLVLWNAAACAFLWIRGCFWCNVASSFWNTACNDYRYCGVYFNAPNEAPQWCANTTPFVPPVVAGDLSRNAEYWQHTIFALVFALVALGYMGMTAAMARWGVFTNEPYQDPDINEEEEEL